VVFLLGEVFEGLGEEMSEPFWITNDTIKFIDGLGPEFYSDATQVIDHKLYLLMEKSYWRQRELNINLRNENLRLKAELKQLDDAISDLRKCKN
jgi:hypothetical protein